MQELVPCKYCKSTFALGEIQDHLLLCPSLKELREKRKQVLMSFQLPVEVLKSFDYVPPNPVKGNEGNLIASFEDCKTELWLGGKDCLSREWLKEHKILFVLNCASELSLDLHVESALNITHRKLPCEDELEFKITPFFASANEFVSEAMLEESNVLVCCAKGVSRSAAFVLATLMALRGSSLRDAWLLVKKNRPCALPNPMFFRELMAYEDKLYPGLESMPADLIALHPAVLL